MRGVGPITRLRILSDKDEIRRLIRSWPWQVEDMKSVLVPKGDS